MHPDGYMISICSMVSMTGKGLIKVFKMNPETPFKREMIGSFDTASLSYQHSFAMTKDYIIVQEMPITFDLEKMVLGKPMMEDMVLGDKD